MLLCWAPLRDPFPEPLEWDYPPELEGGFPPPILTDYRLLLC